MYAENRRVTAEVHGGFCMHDLYSSEKNPAGSVINDEPGGNAVYIEIIIITFFTRAAPRNGLTDVTFTVNSAQAPSRHTRASA